MPLSETIAGILLAAGRAERFKGPKQLALLAGRRLLEWPLDAALASRLDHVYLVLGSHRGEIVSALGERLRRRRLTLVVNRRHRNGQSSSIAAGVEAAGARRAVMILLADQPFVETGLIDRLIAACRAAPGAICAPYAGNRRGHPVVFDRRFFGGLTALQGDRGARAIVDAHEDRVVRVPVNDPRRFLDLDRPADLPLLRRAAAELLTAPDRGGPPVDRRK